MNIRILFSCLFFLLFGPAAQAASPVFVTIAPQKYFVDRISGGTVPALVMVAPGASPHTYEPKPRQMAQLAGAAAFFTIGDSFDQTWLKRISGTNPGISVIHTEEGVAKIPMDVHNHHDPKHGETSGPAMPDHDGDHHPHEGHGPGTHHEHAGLDPHIWLDPNLVKIQATNIRDGLILLDPAHAKAYTVNCDAFLRELDELDREIRDILAPIPPDRRTFLVFHPSWGYFAQAYGLTQAAIEVEGKEPSPAELSRVIATAKKIQAKVIFVQPQFSEKSAAVIARQVGATIVRLDPLTEDWAANLRQAAQAFADALH